MIDLPKSLDQACFLDYCSAAFVRVEGFVCGNHADMIILVTGDTDLAPQQSLVLFCEKCTKIIAQRTAGYLSGFPHKGYGSVEAVFK